MLAIQIWEEPKTSTWPSETHSGQRCQCLFPLSLKHSVFYVSVSFQRLLRFLQRSAVFRWTSVLVQVHAGLWNPNRHELYTRTDTSLCFLAAVLTRERMRGQGLRRGHPEIFGRGRLGRSSGEAGKCSNCSLKLSAYPICGLQDY